MKRDLPTTNASVEPVATATVEDYLALLYVFERDGQPAIASRLAEQVGVALPTATATIKRMTRDGWVSVNERKEIHLTTAGRDIARSVLRRHFLLELLLRRVVGLPWSRIHEEAHAMEHTISQETLELLESKLKHPATCPHGNPLPGEEQAVAHWARLTDLAPGDAGVIRRIHELAEDNAELMAFLEANNMTPGAKFAVREVMPFNQTMTLDVAGKSVVLGLATARWIFAEMSSRNHHSS
ncbi:MAG: metal-dependent transcriptional regulator [Anaerolineae bacterium]